MKELSTEDKANRYDKAIEIAKSKIKNDKDHVLYEDDVMEIFPELKGSEDEKIRKQIVSFLKEFEHEHYRSLNFSSWIDWLEKQGEQKLVDKIEPKKFKVGDFIANDYCRGKVVELTNDAYLLDTGQGIPFSCEHNIHLWTIEDAKDGDVLIDKSGGRECPFIFKETKPSDIKTDMLNPLAVLGYCGIGGAGFTKSSVWGDTSNCIYYPATKEQRDLLFAKMHEAGYEWNADEKELNKVIIYEQK